MATACGGGENGLEEMDDSSNNPAACIKLMCKKNGITNGCHQGKRLAQSISDKGLKTVLKVNGCSKIVNNNTHHQSPTKLRPRFDRNSPPEPQKKLRRSPRNDKSDDANR